MVCRELKDELIDFYQKLYDVIMKNPQFRLMKSWIW